MLFTGERAIGNSFLGKKRFADHYIRYNFAKDYCKNKVVLDIACGSGYGTNILSSFAKEIIGMDISKEAIYYNNSNYNLQNGKFVLYDGIKNPYEDKYFDIITSFETIEHIVEYEIFLKELNRVLNNNGTLLISTPNFKGEVYKNKYHVSNFTYNTFIETISKYFNIKHIYYQGKHFYPFPGRGIIESILGIKRDINIHKEKPNFEHHVTIIEATKL